MEIAAGPEDRAYACPGGRVGVRQSGVEPAQSRGGGLKNMFFGKTNPSFLKKMEIAMDWPAEGCAASLESAVVGFVFLKMGLFWVEMGLVWGLDVQKWAFVVVGIGLYWP